MVKTANISFLSIIWSTLFFVGALADSSEGKLVYDVQNISVVGRGAILVFARTYPCSNAGVVPLPWGALDLNGPKSTSRKVRN